MNSESKGHEYRTLEIYRTIESPERAKGRKFTSWKLLSCNTDFCDFFQETLVSFSLLFPYVSCLSLPQGGVFLPFNFHANDSLVNM